jgi:hypothetical protein
MLLRDEADVVDAQIAYHLNAGVDFVIATDHESRDGTTEILESYAREGYLHLIRERGEMRENEWRTRMARLAATEFGADWIIATDAYEFWMPRGESLKDVLTAIPERYTIVQALVRSFVPRPDDGELFAERMTVRRTSQRGSGGRSQEHLEQALRPLFRADPGIVLEPGGATGGARTVPLRAWYPIEVFRFPPSRRGEDVMDDEEMARGLADGSLVVDTRLRDALRTLETAAREAAPARRFALPEDGASRLALTAPDIVDEAAYAVECAEVGEVDVTLLEQHIDELERRIAWLEARFWPRVMRALLRLVRR